MSASPNGLAGGVLALAAIFLPAYLLIVGSLPFWEALRENRAVQSALRGVGAAVVGLLLAALYESWRLPWAVLLGSPLVVLGAFFGVWLTGYDNNVYVQIGNIMLIGLAAKNAILIVEFAKQLQDQGKPRFDAIVEACKVRLRPILMTSFAFILGVLPLVRAHGAGAHVAVAVVRGRVETAFAIRKVAGLSAAWPRIVRLVVSLWVSFASNWR